jgi:hypothetical protein
MPLWLSVIIKIAVFTGVVCRISPAAALKTMAAKYYGSGEWGLWVSATLSSYTLPLQTADAKKALLGLF